MKQRDFSWTTADGLKLHATEWKPDGNVKAVLLLVHGLGEHIGRYQHVAEVLTSAGYALSGFDLRGHGKSEGVRGHSPSYAALMSDISKCIQITRENIPGLPVFLYGHSLGGNLVLKYALTMNSNPKGAIVTSPGLGTADPVPPIKLLMGKLLYSLAPAFQMNNGLDVTGLSRDPDVAQKYTTDPLVHPLISTRWALDMLNNGRYLVEHASELKLPLLLMQGTEDRVVSPELTKCFAQGAPVDIIKYKEWDGYYHELHNEPEKQQVLNYMIDWLDKNIN